MSASGWFVYFIQVGERGPIKIGVAKDVGRRMALFQTGSPEPLRLLGAIPGGRRLERQLHARFDADRLTGEWFKPTPEVRRWATLAGVIDGRCSAEIAGWQLNEDLRRELRRRRLIPRAKMNRVPRGGQVTATKSRDMQEERETTDA